ncbi:MAG: glucosaminidase domain-containing protein [Sulfurimonas sp.]|jgi:Bax protein|nr:glucosaminidase domain-containing protein [Sulfurimonas sp.]
MRFLFTLFLLGFSLTAFALDNATTKYITDKVPKKERFYNLIVPHVEKVHTELLQNYYRVKKDMIKKQNRQEIDLLKRRYKTDSDLELLYSLYPHPPSIVIAQAAMESAWATSRFFNEAYNIFGMWSKNENEPRIAAGVQRAGGRTIWLKKFDSVEESIRAYYKLMARGSAFKEFRKTRFQTENVHKIVKKLDKYSEIGDLYAKELSQVIRYNKLTKYDN